MLRRTHGADLIGRLDLCAPLRENHRHLQIECTPNADNDDGTDEGVPINAEKTAEQLRKLHDLEQSGALPPETSKHLRTPLLRDLVKAASAFGAGVRGVGDDGDGGGDGKDGDDGMDAHALAIDHLGNMKKLLDDGVVNPEEYNATVDPVLSGLVGDDSGTDPSGLPETVDIDVADGKEGSDDDETVEQPGQPLDLGKLVIPNIFLEHDKKRGKKTRRFRRRRRRHTLPLARTYRGPRSARLLCRSSRS